MSTLSLETLQMVAWGKGLLGLGVATILLAIWKGELKPVRLAALASALAMGFYGLISASAQRMWWGNNGDEVFIATFLTHVMKAHPLQDFYYAHLPVFYPPLYFWVTGTMARFFLENGVAAAKLGVVLVLSVWFFGTFVVLRRVSRAIEEETILKHPWVPVVLPIALFFLVDFNDLMLKPYEAISALGCLVWAGVFAASLSRERWGLSIYASFILSGAVLFLTYYFWWFILIPVLALFVFEERLAWKRRLGRVIGVGGGIALLASPYLVPLLWSYRTGIEHWQAQFFVPQDLSTFLPFFELNLRSVLVIAGVLGLVWFRRDRFVRSALFILLASYAWQFFNIGRLVLGKAPLQSAKPFLFLGMSALALGATRILIFAWERWVAERTVEQKKCVAVGLLILSLPFWPMTRFLDDPVVRAQIEKNRTAPSVVALIPVVERAVPDYADRLWLTSGVPELNLYLPLHFYLAHNPHFSHPAVRYSERRAMLDTFALSSPGDAVAILDQMGVNALLLYRGEGGSTYPVFLWADQFPNGGKEDRVDLPKATIDALGWEKRFENREWVIYVR